MLVTPYLLSFTKENPKNELYLNFCFSGKARRGDQFAKALIAKVDGLVFSFFVMVTIVS